MSDANRYVKKGHYTDREDNSDFTPEVPWNYAAEVQHGRPTTWDIRDWIGKDPSSEAAVGVARIEAHRPLLAQEDAAKWLRYAEESVVCYGAVLVAISHLHCDIPRKYTRMAVWLHAADPDALPPEVHFRTEGGLVPMFARAPVTKMAPSAGLLLEQWDAALRQWMEQRSIRERRAQRNRESDLAHHARISMLEKGYPR